MNKKLPGFMLVTLLLGCNQTELHKLTKDRENLTKHVEKLSNEVKNLDNKCNEAVEIYKIALKKNSPDTDEKKMEGRKLCEKAGDIHNQILENTDKLIQLSIAITIEEQKVLNNERK